MGDSRRGPRRRWSPPGVAAVLFGGDHASCDPGARTARRTVAEAAREALRLVLQEIEAAKADGRLKLEFHDDDDDETPGVASDADAIAAVAALGTSAGLPRV
jgi:hypothetical protein